jgi:iron-sulfur cluster repair protein YtfE (RIC family)
MQAGPARANELFARLSETSDGAVKTREKLFSELKAELELHTHLEEQHLFPLLKRNPETKGLVADATKDNKELRAKLAELDALPKNDEAFPGGSRSCRRRSGSTRATKRRDSCRRCSGR